MKIIKAWEIADDNSLRMKKEEKESLFVIFWGQIRSHFWKSGVRKREELKEDFDNKRVEILEISSFTQLNSLKLSNYYR